MVLLSDNQRTPKSVIAQHSEWTGGKGLVSVYWFQQVKLYLFTTIFRHMRSTWKLKWYSVNNECLLSYANLIILSISLSCLKLLILILALYSLLFGHFMFRMFIFNHHLNSLHSLNLFLQSGLCFSCFCCLEDILLILLFYSFIHFFWQ
jgi:hypothetical protein